MSIMNDQPYISAQLMKHDFDVETIDTTWNDGSHTMHPKRNFLRRLNSVTTQAVSGKLT